MANEAGSLHRRGVAAYLAVHGLLGQIIPAAGHQDGGPCPDRLAFETDQPTDDITCQLSDGSAMYVSAKRKCGDDAHLRDTVSQWIAQVHTLGPDDLLVLAVAEPTGPVKHLGAALRKWRTSSSAYLAPEERAIQTLRAMLPATVRDRVLSAARVLKVEAVEAGDPEFDLAAALLQDTIVAPGSGPAAVRALSESMHTHAGKALSSRLSDWVHVLRAAGVEVYADGNGPRGAAEMARQVALEAYQAGLVEQSGYLDLSLLAEDLPPLRVQGLSDGLQVHVPGERKHPEKYPLLAVARRWPRMLLVGLPGSGKSLALRQLAGAWAQDSLAPVPVHVSLGPVARRCSQPGSLTLSVLCAAAAQGAPTDQQQVLAVALEQLCLNGGAVLLLDGLDECRNRARIADDLLTVTGSVPPGTGVIVATRASGEQAAARLGFPAATLATPGNLDVVMRKLLEHAAQRRVQEHDRPAWLASRTSWLEEAGWDYREMNSVPLLATLLVLVAATRTAGDQLPASKARLLLQAVTDSVRTWEVKRAEGEERADWASARQLLEGYAVIGHRLAEAVEISASDAESAVSEMLANQWGLAPGAAAEATENILWFWDEHVGVFVKTENGVLTARSRVFCEIASAMWVAALPETRIAQWVAHALHDPERSESLELAAGLEPKVIAALLAQDDLGARQAAALVAATAVGNGMALPALLLTDLMDSLKQGALQEAISARKSDGPAAASPGRRRREETEEWACARELAKLRLPAALLERRRSLVASLRLTSEQRIMATALCALSEADSSGSPLTGPGEQAVRQALGIPLPRKGRVKQTPDGVLELESGPSPLSGHAEVAIGAADNLLDLDHNTAKRIHQIGNKSYFRVYPRVAQALSRRGHHFSPSWSETLRQIQQTAAAWNNHPELPLLQAAVRLSSTPVAMTPADAWRLTSLLDLFGFLAAPAVSMQDLLAALTSDTDRTRDTWLRCAATAAGLDTGAVATNARRAISESRQPGNEASHHLLQLIITPPPGPAPKRYATPLDPETQRELVGLLSAHSDWIASTSGDMLCGTRSDQLRDQILAALTNLPAPRRRKAAFVAAAVATDREQTAAALLGQPDPAARAGAARLLSRLRPPSLRTRRLLIDASKSNDLTIRVASRQPHVGHPEATTWSCPDCATYNEPAQKTCQNCGSAAGPLTLHLRALRPAKAYGLGLTAEAVSQCLGARPSIADDGGVREERDVSAWPDRRLRGRCGSGPAGSTG